MMPQKQNPDVLELIRARYHQALAYVSQLQTILGNLPSGYNRDLQLTKEPVFYIIDLTQETLAMTGLVFESLKVNPKACKEAMTEELYAAEKAYKLSAEKGIPFRDAYLAVKNTK